MTKTLHDKLMEAKEEIILAKWDLTRLIDPKTTKGMSPAQMKERKHQLNEKHRLAIEKAHKLHAEWKKKEWRKPEK